MPGVIASQIDVLPAQRGDVRQQRLVNVALFAKRRDGSLEIHGVPVFRRVIAMQARDLPGVGATQPVIRLFMLPAVLDGLLENPVLGPASGSCI